MSNAVVLFNEHLDNYINKTWNFAGRCKTWEDEVNNAVLGLAGEAGETADQIKKAFYHTDKGFEFHKQKLTSELGDVVFYMIKLMDLTGIKLEDVMQANRDKLESRHPELGKVDKRFADGYIK